MSNGRSRRDAVVAAAAAAMAVGIAAPEATTAIAEGIFRAAMAAGPGESPLKDAMLGVLHDADEPLQAAAGWGSVIAQ